MCRGTVDSRLFRVLPPRSTIPECPVGATFIRGGNRTLRGPEDVTLRDDRRWWAVRVPHTHIPIDRRFRSVSHPRVITTGSPLDAPAGGTPFWRSSGYGWAWSTSVKSTAPFAPPSIRSRSSSHAVLSQGTRIERGLSLPTGSSRRTRARVPASPEAHTGVYRHTFVGAIRTPCVRKPEEVYGTVGVCNRRCERHR